MRGLKALIGVAIAAAAFLAVYGFTSPAAASAKYTKDTGKKCAYCHDGSPKDGKLTPKGECFKDNGHSLDKCGD